MHRVYVGDLLDLPPLTSGQVIALEGDEASHLSRVKRLGVGDPVGLLDGRGHVATSRIIDPHTAPASAATRVETHGSLGPSAGQGIPTPVDRRHLSSPKRRDRAVYLRVENVVFAAPLSPRLEVWSAVPKGGRVDELVDQLSQLGVAVWVPMHCARSVVEPRDHKLDRLRRIAVESAKQCGRAWLMEIAGITPFERAFAALPAKGGEGIVLLADAEGNHMSARAGFTDRLLGAAVVRLLIGPEGGWDDRELDRARGDAPGGSLPIHVVRFGPHTMRIETAATAAAAIVMNALQSGRRGQSSESN
jgi:16S rRNA (uracil1498-N3)-methyltransferase